MSDPVALRLTDGTDGRTGTIATDRERAERIVEAVIQRHGTRFLCEIDRPPETRLVLKMLAVLEGAIAFLSAYKWLAGGGLLAVLLVLTVYLPGAHLRAFPAVALVVLSAGLGFLADKSLPPLPKV